MKNKYSIFEFDGIKPVIHETSYIHPNATIIGHVVIGKKVFVGAGAVIRGDWGKIIVEDGCNIQENCIIHQFPGTEVLLKKNAHIGHGAIIHGATIGENTLIGMNSVLMDEVEIGDESIVGAMAFVKTKTKFESRSIIIGNPAKKVKDVTDQMLQWKMEGTKLYQLLPAQCKQTLKPCKPLRKEPKYSTIQKGQYKIWKNT